MGGDHRELVLEALRSSGDTTPWTQVEILTHGTSALVALTARTAVRIARDDTAGRHLLRSQRLVDALPCLPFQVPISTGPATEHDGVVAVPTVRVDGEPHPPGDGDPGPLRELLEAIHGLDISPDHPDLAERRAFTGGERWMDVLLEGVVPRLPRRARTEARRRIERLIELPEVDLCFSHGDLAGENVRWKDGRVAAVIDWDLATYEDPAEDIASLAWWHGWAVLPQLTDAATAARAEVYRDAFPLQMIAFQISSRRADSEIEATIDRVVPVLER